MKNFLLRCPKAHSLAGAFLMLLGAVVLLGWLTHDMTLVQIRETYPSMKFNTALSFIFSGGALLLLGTPLRKYIPWLGGLVALVGLATLSEYVTGGDLRIDEIVFKSHDQTAGLFPGRMSPLTASGFLLAGMALVFAAAGKSSRLRSTFAGISASVVGSIAAVALCGYLLDIEIAYGWGARAKMAVHTAAAFFMMSVGLLAWLDQLPRKVAFDISRWLPPTASLTLMLMVSLVFYESLSELKRASEWRMQSFKVLVSTQTFIGCIFDSQSALRAYVITGNPSALKTSQAGVEEGKRVLAEIANLVREAPDQEKLLGAVRVDFDQLADYMQKIIPLYQTQGLQGVIQLETSGGRSIILIKRLSDDTKAFGMAEHELLNARSVAADASFRSTSKLIVSGGLLAFLLIVVSNVLGRREVYLRRKAESRFREIVSLQTAILNATNYAIISTTENGVVTSFNSTAEQWIGYSAAEVIGKATPALWHDAGEIALRARALSEELGRPIAPGFEVFVAKPLLYKIEVSEWTFRRKDGSHFPVSLSVTVLTDDEGVITGYLGVISDITERRKAEQELKEKKDRLDAILNTSLDGLIVYDGVRDASGVLRDLRMVLVNPAAERISGKKSVELIGTCLLELYPDLAGGELFGKFTRIIQEDVALDFEYRSPRRDPTRWYRVAGVKLGDGLVVSYTEITVRKQGEEQVVALARRLGLATQAMRAGVWDWDVRTNEIVWDEKMYELYGIAPETSIAYKTWAYAVVSEDLPQAEATLRELITSKKQADSEFRIQLPNGSIRHIHAAQGVILDEAGEVARVIGVNIDMTDSWLRKEALRRSEERFSSAFEHATTGMALVSLEGRWLKVNQSLCGLLGYSEEELGSRTFQDITHPDDLEPDLANVRRLINGESSFYKMEKRYFHKDGHVVWVLLGVSLLRDEQNKPLYFISQIEDISELKMALIRQQELTEKARAAERAKSEFLAIMSHEIRTPMNGVIGMTSLLADSELNEVQREYLNTIHTSGESLLMVINDILDYSKIESGKLRMESKPFNLERCIQEAFDLFLVQIRLKQLEVVYAIAPNVPRHVMGDAMRLRQILVNLIGNAIKFTEHGEILVKVERQTIGEKDRLLFSVADTGVGIPRESFDRLFQAFQQVDSSTTRRHGGTGLGLVICKRLAEFMGGKMWVESEPGVGSTFFFTMMLKISDEHRDDTAYNSAELQGRSVLLVGENETSRRALGAQMKTWGMVFTEASSGLEALEKLHGRKFDAALLDSRMPDMDVVALARAMRQTGEMPLILLSSSEELLDAEDARLFQHQIPKPIKYSQLFHALIKVVGSGGKNSQVPTGSRFDGELASRHPLSILLAEDNPTNQKVCQLMLARLGYSVDLAVNGREAVEAAGNGKYDLVFMDIQMPELNGIEAARMIREQLGSKSPVIVAMTAEALEGDEARLLREGFDGYISKPLHPLKLQEMLMRVKSAS